MKIEELIASLRDLSDPYNFIDPPDIDHKAVGEAAEVIQRMIDWETSLKKEGGVGIFIAKELRNRLEGPNG